MNIMYVGYFGTGISTEGYSKPKAIFETEEEAKQWVKDNFRDGFDYPKYVAIPFQENVKN